MTYLNLHMWGNRRRNWGDPKPEQPQAFSNSDYNQLRHAVEQLASTQLGCLYDDFTADELRQLFVPEQYREALTTTYSLQSDGQACGEIYVDLNKVLDDAQPVFPDDPKAWCVPKKVVLRVIFSRGNMPDGFVTPDPLFGTHSSPIPGLRGMPDPELHEKFTSTMQTMLRVLGEWSVVKWVLAQLQFQLRTPQQVRYIWPAIYTLATTANLRDASLIATASARAGNNSVVPPAVLPYLKASYEVVARSVMLGVNTDYTTKYRNGQLRIVTDYFEISTPSGAEEITGP